MTLDLEKFLTNSLTKQFKIAHLDCNVMVFKVSDIPENISKKIIDQYGETYLEDSQYVIFFKGGIDKEVREKLFKQVDRALGGNKDKKKNANLLTVGDLRLLKMSDDEESFGDEEQEDSGIQDQVNDIVNEPEDSEEAEEAPETTDDEISDDEEIADNKDAIDDTLSDDSSDDEEVEESVNEDDDDEDDDSSEATAEEKPALPTKYVFLKITLKK